MVPVSGGGVVPVPSPAYQRTQRKRRPALHLDALTLVTRLRLLALCLLAVHLAVHLAQHRSRRVPAGGHAAIARNPSCCLRCCAPCGACRTRICMNGWWLDPSWRSHAGCRPMPRAGPGCPAPPNNAAGAHALALRRARACWSCLSASRATSAC